MWCRGTSAPSHAQRLLYNMNCILLLSQHTAYHICAVYIFAACLHICCITVAVLRSLVRSPYPAPLLWRQQVCRYLKAADYQTSLWFCDSCSCTLHCTNTLLWQLFLHTALYKYIVVTAVPAHCTNTLLWQLFLHTALYKYIVVSLFTYFWARSQHCEKPLLASSCLSVCPSAWNNSAPTGRVFMKFDIVVFFENLSRKSRFR